MATLSDFQFTQLLNAAGEGSVDAVRRLLPLVLAQLRELARQRLNRERSGQMLQATALVRLAATRRRGR